MVEGMALCRRPKEEKEGQAANLELAGCEQRQHLASLEKRMEGCCSSMETRTNKRLMIEGERKTNPLTDWVDLGQQGSETRLGEEPRAAQT